MLDQKFYWGTIRKAVVAFGNMFNNITIDRKDANGSIIQTIKVPLSYSPKQKFLTKIRQHPNVDNQNLQVIVPRMGFEMVSLDYWVMIENFLMVLLCWKKQEEFGNNFYHWFFYNWSNR